MTNIAEDLVALPKDQGEPSFESVYREHLPLLIGVAIERFRIAEADAESLAHEIFLAYFLKRGSVRNTRAWLLGAMFNSCRQFFRERARAAPLPTVGDSCEGMLATRANGLDDLISLREVLSLVTARCELALRMRYVEGFTTAEIAAQLRTTTKYAQNLVCRCLEQARRRCSLGRGV